MYLSTNETLVSYFFSIYFTLVVAATFMKNLQVLEKIFGAKME